MFRLCVGLTSKCAFVHVCILLGAHLFADQNRSGNDADLKNVLYLYPVFILSEV